MKSKNKKKNLTIRSGVYYITAKRTVNGKPQRLSRSTGIPVDKPTPKRALKDACDMRDRVLRAWRQERTEAIDNVKLRDDTANIGELCDAYRAIVERHGKPKMKTARDNIASLNRIVKTCNMNKVPSKLSVNVLDKNLVVKFTNAELSRSDDKITTQISINSTLRQARSIFKRTALNEYPECLIPNKLPGFLTQFACVDPMREKARETSPPTKKEIAPLLAGSKELRKTHLWPVWLLSYYLGMRASEIENCRWSWFEMDKYDRHAINIKSRPEEGYAPKGRRRSIPIDAEVWELIEESRGEGEYLIPATSKTARYNKAHREYNEWIKSFDWKHKKKSHAIRSYRIEQWRMAYGDSVARDWGGHVTDQTTRDHYTGNMHAEDPLGKDE